MSNTRLSTIISRNLASVHDEIAAACERVGRLSSSVQLIAVTKYAEWEWVQTLAEHHTVFGENRPQQLSERSSLLPDAEWHLIGQLQRNKVRLAIQHAHLIHSVDSLKLLYRIASVASELQLQPRALLQVNVSGEASKSGFAPGVLTEAWSTLVTKTGPAKIMGFMTMAPVSDDPEDARATFCKLANLRNELANHPTSQQAGLTLPELSMGMSGDFETAIEEGATMVRVGRRLYEGI